MIVTIAAIAEKSASDRSDHNRDRWERTRVYLGDRSDRERPLINLNGPLSSDRSDWQLSQNAFQTIQYCGFHGRNYQNTTVYAISLAKIIQTSTRY